MTNSFANLASKILEDYKKIPRDEKLSEEVLEKEKEEARERMGLQSDITEKSKEELAVQDMRELLDFIEKKISGNLTDQDEKIIKEKAEQWGQSIRIIKNSLLN